MTGPQDGTISITARTALEALRNGVPNAEAVRRLGCLQPKVVNEFSEGLARMERRELGSAGAMMFAGDFGAGKSHCLEFLEAHALERRFVVSRIVVSKETPLHDPVKVFRSALHNARLPGVRGFALTELVSLLKPGEPAYQGLFEWANDRSTGLDQRFPLLLQVFSRSQSHPDIRNRVFRFFAGEPIGVKDTKDLLKLFNESAPRKITTFRTRDLAVQRFRFLGRMIAAAGFSGWVLLFDEVELIGRYPRLQRAASYAEIARWFGKAGAEATATDSFAVFALSSDFVPAVLEGKKDWTKVREVFEKRDKPTERPLIQLAEKGMKVIDGARLRLAAPDGDLLTKVYDGARAIYQAAYDWTPVNDPARARPRSTSTRMREYVRAWITEWDLQRLDPQYRPDIETTPVSFDYEENPVLAPEPEIESAEDPV